MGVGVAINFLYLNLIPTKMASPKRPANAEHTSPFLF